MIKLSKASVILLVAIMALSVHTGYAQANTVALNVAEESPVKWLSFEEAVEKSKTEKRKIFIDVYTDWCGWCKVMDKNTFSEEKIAKILFTKRIQIGRAHV